MIYTLLATQIMFVKLATLLARYNETSPCILLLTKTTSIKQLKPRVCLYEVFVYLARQKVEIMPHYWFAHFQSEQLKL